MLKQIEGSRAVAEAVALCRPEVICAYPISPQTHIVEGLGAMVKNGALRRCEFINVESEFAAMSVAIGASAAGARAYTATASQGLLFMAEAMFNASGLGLPIVMTVANRAIGAPINIWNDHNDAMSQRDCGWIQLFAEDNQEALDLHIQAFRLAEELSVPVMVCMDGFILTHAYERVDVPAQEQVDAYLPPYEPRQVLDPAEPVSIGAMVGPEAFIEVRYLAHAKQMQRAGADSRLGGRVPPGIRPRLGRAHAHLSHRGRRHRRGRARLRARHDQGHGGRDARAAARRSACSASPASVRGRSPRCARRSPLRSASSCSRRVSRSASAASSRPTCAPRSRGGRMPCLRVIAGLGGRAITKASLARVFGDAIEGGLEPLTFLDLDRALVDRQLARERETRRSGPLAESILRDVGVVAAKIG